jgi:hypothetical protein
VIRPYLRRSVIIIETRPSTTAVPHLLIMIRDKPARDPQHRAPLLAVRFDSGELSCLKGERHKAFNVICVFLVISKDIQCCGSPSSPPSSSD